MLVKRDDCVDVLIEFSKGGDLEFVKVVIVCCSVIRNGIFLSLLEM